MLALSFSLTPATAPWRPSASLAQALRTGAVLPHGRLQRLLPDGTVVSDVSAAHLSPPWTAPLAAVLDEWERLPADVRGLRLCAVYVRGSLPRGLALPHLSDIDTVGLALTPSPSPPRLAAWRARGAARSAAVRAAFPHVASVEMSLVAAPRASRLGRWLAGAAAPLDGKSLRRLDAFRLSAGGLCVYGDDVLPRLPAAARRVRPRLLVDLRADVSRARRGVEAMAAEGSARGGEAQAVARWAAKRVLRGGMEVGGACAPRRRRLTDASPLLHFAALRTTLLTPHLSSPTLCCSSHYTSYTAPLLSYTLLLFALHFLHRTSPLLHSAALRTTLLTPHLSSTTLCCSSHYTSYTAPLLSYTLLLFALHFLHRTSPLLHSAALRSTLRTPHLSSPTLCCSSHYTSYTAPLLSYTLLLFALHFLHRTSPLLHSAALRTTLLTPHLSSSTLCCSSHYTSYTAPLLSYTLLLFALHFLHRTSPLLHSAALRTTLLTPHLSSPTLCCSSHYTSYTAPLLSSTLCCSSHYTSYTAPLLSYTLLLFALHFLHRTSPLLHSAALRTTLLTPHLSSPTLCCSSHYTSYTAPLLSYTLLLFALHFLHRTSPLLHSAALRTTLRTPHLSSPTLCCSSHYTSYTAPLLSYTLLLFALHFVHRTSPLLHSAALRTTLRTPHLSSPTLCCSSHYTSYTAPLLSYTLLLFALHFLHRTSPLLHSAALRTTLRTPHLSSSTLCCSSHYTSYTAPLLFYTLLLFALHFLVAVAYGGFSRDLLPCHEAIEAQLDGAADASLAALQWACAPTASGREGLDRAYHTLQAAEALHHHVEDAYLRAHFHPLPDPLTLRRPSPLPPRPPPAASLASLASRASLAAATCRAARLRAARGGREAFAASDPLPRLTVRRGGELRALAWAAASPAERARVEAEAARVLAEGAAPLVLRGAAAALVTRLGETHWNLDSLPAIVRSGNVRVSPGPQFVFCKESHPLVREGSFSPPSRTTAMSGDEFVRRLTSSPPSPPLFFQPAAERYYLQADIPNALLDELSIRPFWSALGLSEAQPPRLWVSGAGAITPLHFDISSSYLAQVRGTKRLIFYPPEAMDGLYPYPIDHPLSRRSRVGLYTDREERHERFPLFSQIESLAMEVTLEEGDCVFFPAFWSHHVESLSLSFSIGCRYV
ncbi:hypothetical protein AB1Y20_013410 [Prymnesium parvum]|uniref:JmjC domain-containing protein n=1 Tax=Prymnesium parvum TaxID=97485 RepID=A0AB34IHR5_PRYPA